jgi:hypothetical protein
MYRNVDVLVRNTDELIVFLSVFVEASEKPRPEFDAEAIPNAQALRPVGTERNFYFSRDVVSPFLSNPVKNVALQIYTMKT